MRKGLIAVATGIVFVLYPVAIWAGLTYLSARSVGLWVLALLVPMTLARFRHAKREDILAVLRIPLVIAAAAGLTAALDDARYVFAMPVVINVALLATFGLSLRGTPIIERFARMQEKGELSEDKRRHCRQVTWAWALFFALNASVAAMLAWISDPFWWAAYNGGIAYGLMGLMFAGEYILRKARFREYGGGIHDKLLSKLFPSEQGPAEESDAC
ncbi:MAG: hypothetical protein AB7S26_31005 [Sandaracinaceae bacterium]